MSKMEALEEEVRQLSPEERVAFCRGFEKFDAQTWDRPREADALADKLDALAEEALKDYPAGRITPL
jgi:hypothetical protein